MIRKTLILTLILIAVYAVFVSVAKPNLGWATNQWQDNNIKAQRFLYKDRYYEKVILGSSLSTRLVMDSLPDYYNLCFGALSIYEGMDILVHEEMLPKTVFIETHTILNQSNNNFTSALLNPLLLNARKINPSLRDGNQPALLVQPTLQRLLGKVANTFKGHSLPANADSLFNIAINPMIETFSGLPGEAQMNEALKRLTPSLQYLNKKGVHVVFFDMPLNCRVSSLLYFSVVRKFISDRFPKYKYLPAPDCASFKTTDGIHLNEDEAKRYTSFFYTSTRRL